MRNIPLNFVIKTILSVAVLTLLIRYGETYIKEPIIHADALLSSIIGAIFCGTGLGLVYSVNGSTGGTDIIGAVVTKFRHVSMGRVLLLVDVLIVGSSYFLFQSLEKIAIRFPLKFWNAPKRVFSVSDTVMRLFA